MLSDVAVAAKIVDTIEDIGTFRVTVVIHVELEELL